MNLEIHLWILKHSSLNASGRRGLWERKLWESPPIAQEHGILQGMDYWSQLNNSPGCAALPGAHEDSLFKLKESRGATELRSDGTPDVLNNPRNSSLSLEMTCVAPICSLSHWRYKIMCIYVCVCLCVCVCVCVCVCLFTIAFELIWVFFVFLNVCHPLGRFIISPSDWIRFCKHWFNQEIRGQQLLINKDQQSWQVKNIIISYYCCCAAYVSSWECAVLVVCVK